MKNNNNICSIVIREKIWNEESKRLDFTYTDVPATREDFDNYYRPINAYRKKQQRHGKCRCPDKRRLECDMDCWSCSFHCNGDTYSIENSISNDGKEDILEFKDLIDDTCDIEAQYVHRELLDTLHEKLNELEPLEKRICELYMNGKSDRGISEILGIPKSTVGYRKNKIFEKLRCGLKDFF